MASVSKKEGREESQGREGITLSQELHREDMKNWLQQRREQCDPSRDSVIPSRP
jgi:hypothetical protein